MPCKFIQDSQIIIGRRIVCDTPHCCCGTPYQYDIITPRCRKRCTQIIWTTSLPQSAENHLSCYHEFTNLICELRKKFRFVAKTSPSLRSPRGPPMAPAGKSMPRVPSFGGLE